jgi:hypothetical protein
VDQKKRMCNPLLVINTLEEVLGRKKRRMGSNEQ